MSMREKLDALAEKIAEYASADCRFAVSEARVKYWHDELRAILAETPAESEPVAWRWSQLMHDSMGGWETQFRSSPPSKSTRQEDVRNITPLYTTPPDTVPRAEYERVRKLADDLDSENQAKFLSLRFHCERAERAEAERERLLALAKDAHVAWDSDKDSRVGKLLVAMMDEQFCRTYRPDLFTQPEGRGRE